MQWLTNRKKNYFKALFTGQLSWRMWSISELATQASCPVCQRWIVWWKTLQKRLGDLIRSYNINRSNWLLKDKKTASRWLKLDNRSLELRLFLVNKIGPCWEGSSCDRLSRWSTSCSKVLWANGTNSRPYPNDRSSCSPISQISSDDPRKLIT